MEHQPSPPALLDGGLVVKRVADGSYKRSAACKNFLEAGAVLWAWDADPARKEKAGSSGSSLSLDSGTGTCGMGGALVRTLRA